MDFDGNLEKMDKNLDSKIDEIQKLLNCWIYRSLTVYGRMVVVKTLALSKLSHVALIISCLKQNRIKEIENIIFKIIWGVRTRSLEIMLNSQIALVGSV